MAKARIGHFAEAQVLEALEVDYIDESEVLTPADEANHIDKWAFKIPFVCGATNLGEALRRIGEGAAMIRSKGEAGTGDIVEAVRHLRMIRGEIRRPDDARSPKSCRPPPRSWPRRCTLVRQVAAEGRLPVVLFCAGGIATPADASLVMQLGAEGVFVGSGIFKSEDPAASGAGDRRGDDALPRPRAGRGGRRRARPADGQPRDLEARVRAAARPARLVVRRRDPGSLPAATSRRGHRRRTRAAGRLRGAREDAARARAPSRARCACPADLEGLDALVIPGGESTVMTLGIEREGLAEPLRRSPRPGRRCSARARG